MCVQCGAASIAHPSLPSQAIPSHLIRVTGPAKSYGPSRVFGTVPGGRGSAPNRLFRLALGFPYLALNRSIISFVDGAFLLVSLSLSLFLPFSPLISFLSIPCIVLHRKIDYDRRPGKSKLAVLSSHLPTLVSTETRQWHRFCSHHDRVLAKSFYLVPCFSPPPSSLSLSRPVVFSSHLLFYSVRTLSPSCSRSRNFNLRCRMSQRTTAQDRILDGVQRIFSLRSVRSKSFDPSCLGCGPAAGVGHQ